MDVISDRGVAKETLAPAMLASGQAHEQRPAWVIPGLPVMVGALAVMALAIVATIVAGHNSALRVIGIIVIAVVAVSYGGLFVVQPNEARVLILFGRYIGSVTEAGWWWCNPFAKKQKLSLRVRNFQNERIKVNDASGNPIEIAAVIVWRITDTAKAMFDVDGYERFVTVQSETSLRHLASEYPYDDYRTDRTSLRGNADEVRNALQAELQERLQLAGVEVVEVDGPIVNDEIDRHGNRRIAPSRPINCRQRADTGSPSCRRCEFSQQIALIVFIVGMKIEDRDAGADFD